MTNLNFDIFVEDHGSCRALEDLFRELASLANQVSDDGDERLALRSHE